MMKKNKIPIIIFVFAISVISTMLLLSLKLVNDFSDLHIVVKTDAIVPDSLPPGVFAMKNTSQINITADDYLFLPSSVKLDALTLNFTVKPGAEIAATTSANPAAAPLYISPGSPANIASLFPSVPTLDFEYPITLTDRVNGDVIDFTIMKAEIIPSMHVTTEKNAITWLNSDKARKESGSLCMIAEDGSYMYNDALETIGGRGYGSWDISGDKKSYNIKLISKEELVTGAGAAKKWCLISNDAIDDSNLKYYTSMNLALAMDSSKSPVAVGHVDLYVNGEYRGLYQLTERKEIDSERVDIIDMEKETSKGHGGYRMDIDSSLDAALSGVPAYSYWRTASAPIETDITGGYLMGINVYYNASNPDDKAISGFRTKKMTETAEYPIESGVVVDNPEYATEEQIRYIAKYVQDFENALYSPTGYNTDGKYYTDYIDVPSLAVYFNLSSLVAEWDHMYNNTFFYKEKGEYTKLEFGPLWDFDRSMEEITSRLLFRIDDGGRGFWAEALITKGDFVAAMYDINTNETAPAFQKLMGYGGTNTIEPLSDTITHIHSSGMMNHKIWKAHSWEFDRDYVVNWLNERYAYWNGVAGNISVWDTNTYLRGLVVTESNGVLIANPIGPAVSFQWYVVDPGWMTGTLLPGETNQTFIPDDIDKFYYVVATGAGNMTADYQGSVGSITLTSNPSTVTK